MNRPVKTVNRKMNCPNLYGQHKSSCGRMNKNSKRHTGLELHIDKNRQYGFVDDVELEKQNTDLRIGLRRFTEWYKEFYQA